MTVAAFVLSIVGTVSGVAGLVWSIASWVLTGGRASIELEIGGGSKLTGQNITMPASTPLDALRRTLQRLPVASYEGYFVTVRNKGRTPITVQSIRFAMPGKVAYLTPKGGDWGDELPKRLEPGERLTCANEIRYVFAAAYAARVKTANDVVRVRAVAELGTGKTIRSRETLYLTTDHIPDIAPTS